MDALRVARPRREHVHDQQVNPLRQPLLQYLALRTEERGDQDRFQQLLKERVNRLQFLIMTVADPIETQVNYRFDLQVETLHRALAEENYVPDEFYLPWQKGDKNAEHRRRPAMLLYRNTDDPTKTEKS